MSIFSRVPLNTVVTTSVLAFRSAWSTDAVAWLAFMVLSDMPAHPAATKSAAKRVVAVLKLDDFIWITPVGWMIFEFL
jgi:hypothetical protein